MVDETMTSAAPPSAMTRAAACTARPRGLSPTNSTSPVLDADADRQGHGARRCSHRLRAAHRPDRAVEHGQHAVAGDVDLTPTMCVEVLAQLCVMEHELVAPGLISDPVEDRGRVDDVGNQDGDDLGFVGIRGR